MSREGRNWEKLHGMPQIGSPSKIVEDTERQRRRMQSEIDDLMMMNENRELKNQISVLKKQIDGLKSDT